MDLSNPWLIVDYHKNRTVCDDKFIIRVFDAQRMQLLRQAQERHPHSIIRMTNDLAGSVPPEWDGSTIMIPGV